jgi:hypothetical protein
MIDVQNEHLIAIRDLPAHLPRRPNGRKVHVSACYRWIRRGVRGAKLEAVRIGGTTYTSLEALQRFADCQNQGAILPERVPTRSRGKQLARADSELDELLAKRPKPADAMTRATGKRP